MSTCIRQHGENDVKNGVTMLLSHVRAKWRPSWYDIAGSLRPYDNPSANGQHLLMKSICPPAMSSPPSTASPDAMDVDHEAVRFILLTFPTHRSQHNPLFHHTQETNNIVTGNATSIAAHTATPTLSADAHGQCEDDRTDVQPAAINLSTSPYQPVDRESKARTTASQQQQGLQTRRQYQEQKRRELGELPETNAVAIDVSNTPSSTLPKPMITGRNVGQHSKMIARQRAMPKRVPRKRPEAAGVPVRIQPKQIGRAHV